MRSPRKLPTVPFAVLPKGSKAWYTDAAGHSSIVTIRCVHHDDVPPYYTILIGGAERETVRERLEPVAAADVAAPAPAPGGAPASEATSDGVPAAIPARSFRATQKADAALEVPASFFRASAGRRNACPTSSPTLCSRLGSPGRSARRKTFISTFWEPHWVTESSGRWK